MLPSTLDPGWGYMAQGLFSNDLDPLLALFYAKTYMDALVYMKMTTSSFNHYVDTFKKSVFENCWLKTRILMFLYLQCPPPRNCLEVLAR